MERYSEGLSIASTLKDLDGPSVNPVCQTRVYTHGRRTERALVLLHGFTSCPQQFDDLGRQLHAQGWNVLIPRYPWHGYSDRLTPSIAQLRSDHLIALANLAADAGLGLGERLTVAGLSLGGILAGYLAQTRETVERAVLIAPMFGLKPIPGPALIGLTKLAYRLPNFYIWWDAKLKEGIGPAYGYPRFSTHAYAALFATAARVRRAARKSAPRATSIAVITNAAEPRLDNRFTYEVVESWRRHGAAVSTRELPLSDGLPHDLIDPSNPEQNTALVYPLVRGMVTGDVV